MEILTRNKCPECEGCGVLPSHMWLQFHHADREYKQQHGDCMSEELMHTWFENKGFYELPKEEFKCPDCEGAGVIEKWVDIREVLAVANIIE